MRLCHLPKNTTPLAVAKNVTRMKSCCGWLWPRCQLQIHLITGLDGETRSLLPNTRTGRANPGGGGGTAQHHIYLNALKSYALDSLNSLDAQTREGGGGGGAAQQHTFQFPKGKKLSTQSRLLGPNCTATFGTEMPSSWPTSSFWPRNGLLFRGGWPASKSAMCLIAHGTALNGASFATPRTQPSHQQLTNVAQKE
jgi:hypothetical protein